MKIIEKKGMTVSGLSLGTVQLGVNYGINNSTGKPDRAEAFAILDAAAEEGVTVFDTAPSYGDSEAVIGEWLASRFGRNGEQTGKKPFIVTKASGLDHSSRQALRDSMFRTAEGSLKALGLSKLPLLMLHNCDDYNKDPDAMAAAFEELKNEGMIRLSGISAYPFHDYRAIAASGTDAVQVPVNVFDWRQIDNGGIDALAKAGMLIFVRSVYMQGLVFQKPETMDPRMEFAKDTIRKFDGLCKKYELLPAQLAMAFVLSLPGIDSLVLGSERAEQVRQNAALIRSLPQLSDAQMQELHEAFYNTDERVLTPMLWFNAM